MDNLLLVLSWWISHFKALAEHTCLDWTPFNVQAEKYNTRGLHFLGTSIGVATFTKFHRDCGAVCSHIILKPLSRSIDPSWWHVVINLPCRIFWMPTTSSFCSMSFPALISIGNGFYPTLEKILWMHTHPHTQTLWSLSNMQIVFLMEEDKVCCFAFV